MTHATGQQATTVRYAVCGLTIEADMPIDGLRPQSIGGHPDLQIALHDGEAFPEPALAAPWYASDERDEAGVAFVQAALSPQDGSRWLQYAEGALFRLDASAARIDGWWKAPLTAVDAATYLLGPVLAFAMRLRGTVPLHASAVSLAGRAALFVGDAGAGKSTTAAALARLGCAVLSDDVVPLACSAEGVSASPGYPRVSLWSDAADALFGVDPQLPAFSDTYPKRYLDLAHAGLAFQDRPLFVGVIFVLGERSGSAGKPVLRRLGGRDSLVALLHHAYGSYLIESRMRATELDVLAAVAGRVPIFEVRFGDTLASVLDGCAALVGDGTGGLASAGHR